MMEQVSKLRLVTVQVKGWDAIPTTIYKKEDRPGRGIEKVQRERNKERERKSEYCKIEKCKP